MKTEPQSKNLRNQEFFSPSLHLILIVFLFITALGIRLYRITDPPFDFHPVRQYHSMLIVRSNFFESLDSVPEWRKQIARLNEQHLARVEPRITEFLTLVAYRLIGAEYTWIPRLFTSIFWLVGGVFIYLLSKEIISNDAAIISTAFYLFLPFGVSASRSFQPDPLMIMMFLAGIFAIYQYYANPSPSKLVIAAIISGLAILVKIVCLFTIFSAFISLSLYKHRLKKTIFHPHLIIFSAISILPFGLYFLYGYFIAGFLRAEVGGRILPQLILTKDYWGSWLTQIDQVVGYTALIGGLLGILVIRNNSARTLLMGLWGGYFIFGLVFTYHITTHDYYQLQFIPIIALSIGPVCALIVTQLGQYHQNWYWRAALLGILLFAVSLSLYKTRWRVINTGYEHEVKIAQEIGELVNHSTQTIYLAPHYGMPLIYHGELSGLGCPSVTRWYWAR